MPKLFQPEQLELSNGIPVILQHYEGPVAATYWWVRTGSADESPKEAGFAHFLEHMLFKDAAAKETGAASSGQTARVIESLGGDINAYTSFDQTVYHVTCAAQHWEKVLDNFGTMAKPQRFLKKDFEREREVILEELRKNEDSPNRQLFQALFSGTFKSHPYGRPVIGYVKTLKAATVEKLENFFRNNYVPEKMGLILVGPIQDATGERRKRILAKVEKHFGAKVIRPRAAKVFARPAESPLRSAPALTVRSFDVKTPTIAFSFRVPDLKHPDVPALDLLSGIMAMGELSRLYQQLFYKTSIATDISGGLYVPKDPGMIYCQVELDSMEKINAASEEIFKELRRLAEEGPTLDEIKRVMVNAESERLYASQTADGVAGRLGFLRFVLGDLAHDEHYLHELRAVDEERIKDVARRYFNYRRLAITALVPKSEAKYDLSEIDEMARELLDFESEESVSRPVRRSGRRSSSALDFPLETITLPSGIKVVHFDRPGSHAFSVHAAVLGGLRLEPSEMRGGAHMMSMTWTKGSTARSAREISSIIEGSAAGLDGFSGRNATGLQLTGLSRDWQKLSELFTEVLVSPAFPEDEIEHSRRVVEDSIRSIEDHSSQLCSRLALEHIFERHPYGKLVYGSLESVKGLHHEQLMSLHRQWMRPERLVIAVCGNVRRKLLDRWLEEMESRLKSAGGAGSELPLSLPDEPTLKAPRWVEKKLGREQAHIMVAGLGTRLSSPDRFGVRVLQTLLGGQGGRLFVELREKKSLAYTVAPTGFEGVERGYIGTYIACSPEKRDEAINGIRSVLEALVRKAPSVSEMSRAKEFYLGRRAMEMQSDSSIAAHVGLEALYGISKTSESEVNKAIHAVSSREIQRICRQYLVEPHMVTSIVG